jgi:hypothetical protein
MSKTVLRIKWWTITALYVIFIYATLNVAPGIWDSVNDLLGGRNDFLLYIVYSAAGLALFYYILFVKKERNIVKYLVLVFYAAVFIIMLRYAQHAREKIHMAEYGLLGIMLYNALKIDFDRFDIKLYLLGVFICALVGYVDELIQGILPNRVFDRRDILMNAVSGILPLLIIRINIIRRESPGT